MPRDLRRPVGFLLAGLLATAAVAWGLWLAAPHLLASRIAAALAARGFEVERLEVTALTGRRARVENIVLGGADAPRIGRVDAVYELRELLEHGRIDRLEVSGARLTLVVGADGGIAVAGLPAPARPDAGPFRLPELPFDRVAIRDSRLRVATPWLDAELPVAATVEVLDRGGLRIDGGARAATALGAASLRFVARVAGNGAYAGDVVVAAPRLGGAPLAIDGLDGWLAVDGGPSAPPSVRGELVAAEMAVPAVSLSDVVVQLGGDAGRRWALLRARWPEADAALRLDAGLADGRVALDGALDSGDLARLAAAVAAEAPVAGRGKLLVSLTTPLDALLAARSARLPTATGTASLTVSGGAVGDLVQGVAAAVGGGLALRDGRAILTGAEPWALSATVGGIGPVAVTVRGDGMTAQRLTIDLGDGAAASLNAGYAVAAGDLAAAGAIDAGIALADGEPPAYAVDRFTATGRAFAVSDAAVAIDRLSLTGRGSAGAFDGRLEAAVGVSGGLPGGVRVEGGRVAGAGAVTFADGVLRFAPDDCLSLAAATAAVEGVAALPEGLRLCAAPRDDGAFLAVTLEPAYGVVAHLATEAATVALELAGAGAPDVAEARLPELALAVAVAADNGWTLDGEAGGGRLTLADPAVELSGIGGAFAVDSRADPAVTIEWRVDEARPLRDPAPLVPLRLSGALRSTPDGFAFAGSGVGGPGGVMLSFDGRHRSGDGGRVTFSVEPISFAPGVRQPEDVAPALEALNLENVVGTVSAAGRYGWGSQSESVADIDVRELSFATPVLAATGLSTSLHAHGLAPVHLPPGQRVSVAGLDIGIPLGPGAATFGLSPDGRLTVADLAFRWAGGRLSAEPFAVSLDDPERALVLRARGIDLTQLLATLPVDALTVTGRLDGRIPIRLDDDTIFIDDAVLRTTGPGVIRYAPARPPAFAEGEDGSMDLLLQALRNFHYDSVTVTLDGRTGEDMAARVEIRGANPDLYDGYPIALNVNVSGALDRILRRGLAATRYADRLEDMIRDRLRPDATERLLDDIEDIQQ